MNIKIVKKIVTTKNCNQKMENPSFPDNSNFYDCISVPKQSIGLLHRNSPYLSDWEAKATCFSDTWGG